MRGTYEIIKLEITINNSAKKYAPVQEKVTVEPYNSPIRLTPNRWTKLAHISDLSPFPYLVNKYIIIQIQFTAWSISDIWT